MSEYATRKIDSKEFKIGTCEDMFNCRYDQISEVIYPYMSDNLYYPLQTRMAFSQEISINPFYCVIFTLHGR